jgi:hypothetical protein
VRHAQLAKIERYAKKLAGGKVALLFDVDDEGESGAKEAHWKLSERGLDVRPGWSRSMHGGRFLGRQPESVTQNEWQTAILPGLLRS